MEAENRKIRYLIFQMRVFEEHYVIISITNYLLGLLHGSVPIGRFEPEKNSNLLKSKATSIRMSLHILNEEATVFPFKYIRQATAVL